MERSAEAGLRVAGCSERPGYPSRARTRLEARRTALEREQIERKAICPDEESGGTGSYFLQLHLVHPEVWVKSKSSLSPSKRPAHQRNGGEQRWLAFLAPNPKDIKYTKVG